MQIEGHLGPKIALIESGVRRAGLASHLADETDGGHGPLVNRNRALSVLICPSQRVVVSTSWSHWFYQGLVLLVIACPCVLVISTPVSFVAALTSAAHQGVLVKGAGYLEIASRLKAIALDKTGTLTVGRPEVKEVVALSGHTEHEVLDIAAAIEARSQHPLAEATPTAPCKSSARTSPRHSA